jgi:hypothetical protein
MGCFGRGLGCGGVRVAVLPRCLVVPAGCWLPGQVASTVVGVCGAGMLDCPVDCCPRGDRDPPGFSSSSGSDEPGLLPGRVPGHGLLRRWPGLRWRPRRWLPGHRLPGPWPDLACGGVYAAGRVAALHRSSPGHRVPGRGLACGVASPPLEREPLCRSDAHVTLGRPAESAGAGRGLYPAARCCVESIGVGPLAAAALVPAFTRPARPARQRPGEAIPALVYCTPPFAIGLAYRVVGRCWSGRWVACCSSSDLPCSPTGLFATTVLATAPRVCGVSGLCVTCVADSALRLCGRISA